MFLVYADESVYDPDLEFAAEVTELVDRHLGRNSTNGTDHDVDTSACSTGR